MDVMKPELYWVGNRCYRKTTEKFIGSENDLLSEKVGRLNIVEDDGEYEHINQEEIEKISNDAYEMKLFIPSSFNGGIIGYKGTRKNILEMETKTKVKVPQIHTPGPIIITGKNPKDLIQARDRINILVGLQRAKMEFTHFLSMPFNDEALIEAFEEFKSDVIRTCSTFGIDESLFQKPSRLHQTLGTLVLVDENERKHAHDILKSCQELVNKHLQGCPLSVRVQGLEYMNDDPSEVDVLYARVTCADGSNKLQHLVDDVQNRFKSTYLINGQENVKLHITLMNSLFNKSAQNSRKTFNAKRILEIFGDHYFGTINIPSICISTRHSAKEGQYYYNTCELSLSSSESKENYSD